MKFEGKFDAAKPPDHPGSHAHANFHVDSATIHAPSDAIIVSDAHLLFGGDYKRSGVDLILSDEHQKLVFEDYFKGEKHAALASPDGSHLTGDIVNALSGGHVDYAQADGAASAAKVIGHVTKLIGTATAIRNGVTIILNQGDNVNKGDVLQSGSDSTVGVTFIDGTVFGLSSNARMVLNEMVYDPNGSNNSSLISLVKGTISFVAGETAKHGDMKVDTPAATMGIRGTAVLVQIDFDVPGQGDVPDARFDVLVEPDGTTGSYILYDKNTLDPIATVNKAGAHVKISHGVVSQVSSELSAEVQKLITDVFSLKFTSTDPTPKSFDHFTDTVIPQTFGPKFVDNGVVAIPVFVNLNTVVHQAASPGVAGNPVPHIPLAPSVVATSAATIEKSATTGSTAIDTASGSIRFVDVNAGDLPTASASFTSFTYTNAHHVDITNSLTQLQLADIKAVEAQISVVATPGNTNSGSATWTYSIADKAFDFLAAGETLTLTYTAEVDSNFAPEDLKGYATFTITINATNDAPVITSSAPTIAFSGGITTPGGYLTSPEATHGTLSFNDVDLTDTHTVTTALTSAVFSGPGTLSVTKVPPGPLQLFETALSAAIGTDSTGTGSGTINWNLANLPVYLADFIPNGETLALTYAVTVTDSQGATSTQNVVVNITGTDTASVVWIATTTPNAAPGGLWSDASNWETGTVPTATDDAIIITNQLIGLTPSYPVTINAPAVAKTVTLNDFSDLGNAHPELINLSTLTVGSTFTLAADSTLNNSGTVTVGGAMEVLNTSVLQNSGQITLQNGGDFRDQSTVTNSGTIEVSGGTLDIDVNVDNTGGHLTIDAGGKVALTGANINHGMVTNTGELDLDGNAVLTNGSLNNTGETIVITPVVTFTANFSSTTTIIDVANTGQIYVSGSGNALDNESVANNGTITVNPGAVLTLDGTTITGGSIIDNGTINVDAMDRLTVSGVTLFGGAVTNAGTIEISGSGSIYSDSFSNTQLTVDAGQVLTLDDTTVTGGTITNTGTVHVDSGDKLALSGVTLSGGSITDAGIVEISCSGSIDNDSFGNNQLTIDASQVLTLDGTTITGGTVTDTGTVHVDSGDKLTLSNVALSAGAITDAGTVEISCSSSIDNDSFSNNQLTVDASQVLTLDGTTVIGGSITDSGTVHVDSGDKLTLSGVALSGGSITNAGTVEISCSGSIDNDSFGNNQLTIDAGQVLTLDGTTVTGGIITDNGTVHVDSSDKLTLNGVALSGGAITDAGTIEISCSGSIDNDSLSNNQLTVDASQILTLDGTTVTGGTVTDNGTVHVDSGDKLTLSGVALSGGAVTNAGTVEVSGSSSIDNDSFGNAQLTIDASQVLTLDGNTLTGGTITNTGTVHVDSGDKLTLSGVALSGGAVTNAGTVEISGSGSIDNDSFGNAQLTVDASQILTLDGTTVTGGTITNTGTVHVDSGDKLTLSGVALSGGAITNAGTVEIGGSGSIDNDTFANNQLTIDASQVLTLDGTTVTGGSVTDNGTVHVDSGDKLTLNGVALSGGSITNAGTVEIGGSGSIDNDTFGNAQLTIDASQVLTLDGTTVTGGSITDAGTIEISGSGSIDNDTFGNAQLTIDASQVLILDGTTVTGGIVTDNGTVHVDSGDKLTLSNVALSAGAITDAGTVEISCSSSIDNDSFSNNQLTVDASQVLTLDGTTVTGGIVTDNGTVHVDSGDKLTLSGVALSGGAITDAGTVEIGGSGSIDNDSFGNNQLTVDASQILTLDGTIVTGGTVTDNGTVHVDSGDKLTLSGVALSGGSITNAGTVEISGSGSIDNDSFGNNQLTVDASQVLTMDGTTVTGGTITNTGTVHVDSGDKLTLSGVAISGGSITDAGTIEISGSSSIDNDSFGNTQLTIDASQVLTLDGTTVTGGTVADNGTVHVDSGDTLTLSGVTLSGGLITDAGAIQVSGDLAVSSSGALSLQGGGALYLSGGEISATGTDGGATLDNFDMISGFGQIGIGNPNVLNVDNEAGGTIEASGGTLKIEIHSALDNAGTLEAASGATLQINIGTINNTGNIDVYGTLALDRSHTDGSALTLNDAGTLTLSGGEIRSIVSAVETLQNNGNTISGTGQIGDGATNYLTLENSVGTIEASGGTLTLETGNTITNASTLEAVSGGTLQIDDSVSNSGLIEANGGSVLIASTAAVTGSGSGSISGGGTLDIAGSDAQGVTFNGAGTLQLDATSDFTGTISGFVGASDIIELVNTTVTSAYFEGATLYVNGQPTSFQFAGVPAGDTIAFKADASGTELELLPQVLAVGSLSAAVGVEGTPIALGFSETVTGATLSHFVISGIPDGAIITDGTPGHSYTSGSANGSVDVATWQLSTLTVTPSNDANFQLSALATAVDGNGFNYTLPEVQTVTVNPTASTLTWSPAVSGIEGQIALGNLIDTVTGQPGDTNSVNTLTISGAPQGVLLGDSHGHSAVSDGATAIDVNGWTLSSLTADTSGATVPTGNFTLIATATEVDGQTNLSTTTTSTEVVTVTPEAPDVTPVAETGVEGTAIALDLGTTVNGLTGDSNSLSSLVVSSIPVGAVLNDDQGNSFTAVTGTQQVDIHGWDLSHLTITPADATNFTLNVAATTQDATGDLSTTTTSTEAVTVTPVAPDVTPVAETGVEGTAIALDLGVAVNGLNGETNSLASLVVSAIPVGAVLNDDQGNSFTAITGTQQVDIHGWDLSHLTITPADATNFTLNVAATAVDAEGDSSITTTSTEAVTVTPEATPEPPTAINESYSVLGTAPSIGSTIVFDATAPSNDPFTVTGVSYGGTDVAFNATDGAFEAQGSHGTLYVYPQAGTSVDVGGFSGISNAGDLVLVVDSDPTDAVHSLAPGATLSDTFGYTITDTVTGLSSTATATFTYADSDIFTGVSGGNWTDASNWMFGVPSSSSGIPAYVGSNEHVDVSGVSIGALNIDLATLFGSPDPVTGLSPDLSGTLVVDSDQVASFDGVIINGGTLSGPGTFEFITDHSTLENVNIASGTLEATSGTLQLEGNISNSGLIEANGGTVVVASGAVITGTPSITIANSGTAEFVGSATVALALNADFTGAGTLILDQPLQYSGTISGIAGSSDVLDLKGFSAGQDAVTASTGAGSFDGTYTTLTITDATNPADSTTLKLAGDYSNSTWTVGADGSNTGIDIVDPPAAVSHSIASGGSLEIASAMAPSETVTFQGSTGRLTLDAPSTFHGTVVGFTGDGTLTGSDQIDLKDVSFASLHESFNASTETLSVSDGTDSATLHFSGNYAAANFSFATDGDGGTIVYDPPVATSKAPASSPTAAVASVVTAVNHGFEFNFTNPAHDTTTDFHPPTNTNHPTPALWAALNAPHDDSHSNPAAPIDAHDTMIKATIIQAQHHADFHFG